MFCKVFAKNGGVYNVHSVYRPCESSLGFRFLFFFISLGCEQLCTDGRLYTILHRKEAVYIVHSVYRPCERPLGFRLLKEFYKFRL